MRRIGIEGGSLIGVKFGMGPNLKMQGIDHFPGQRNRNASHQQGLYDFLQIDRRNHGVTDVVGDQRAARLAPLKRDDGGSVKNDTRHAQALASGGWSC